MLTSLLQIFEGELVLRFVKNIDVTYVDWDSLPTLQEKFATQ